MKRAGGYQFIAGVIVGALVFGGSAAFAAGIAAQPKTAEVVIDGGTVDLKGYVIDGSHYFQLRDLDEKLIPGGKDFSAVWDGQGNRVIIDTSRGYDPNEQYTPPAATDDPTAADGSGRVSGEKLTDKTIDGRELSREDFSQQANPAIFTGIYTRGAYNALRQTIVDRDMILPGNDAGGFDPYYAYANFVDNCFVPGENESGTMMAVVSFTLPAHMSGYYNYGRGVEPYAREYYKYPGYGIVTVSINNYLAPANTATDILIQEVAGLSGRDKVIRLANAICDRLTYGSRHDGGINEIFTSSAPIQGLCGTYAEAFLYLCQRAGIPCLTVSDSDHAWNTVYVDGEWQVADVTNYSTARSMMWLLAQGYPKQPKNPAEAMFLQEALVPGSTK